MKERVGGPQHIPVRGGLQGLARQVLKKNCEIGVGFSFAALSVFRLRRAEAASAVWIQHSLPDIRSLSNRKGRGRRSGGREREPRRAGEASPKPPPKPPPKPRSGLCPELLADFRIPKPPGCSQGRRGHAGEQYYKRVCRRGGEGASLGSAWRRVGVPRRSRC